MLALTAFKTFFVDNIKWVALLAALFVFSFVGYKAYDLIQENVSQKSVIEKLEKDLKYSQLKIKLNEQNYVLLNNLVNQRDATIDDLNAQLEGTTENIGLDVNEKAPKSVMEYLERIKKTAR